MGKVLQIKVTCWTWNEDLIEKEWPRLSELAFSVPLKHEKHGVMEMVKALGDGLSFMKWSEERKDALGNGIKKALDIKMRLEDALSNWDPRKANALSDELEIVLDDLEVGFK